MKPIIRKILNIITTFIVSVVSIIALMLVVPKVLNIDMFVVLSGSMEPTYKTGSIIYVAKQDEYHINDVVTFKLSDSTIATHRIVDEVMKLDQKAYVTKGDANDYEDKGLLFFESIIGKVVFTIPYLGYIITFFQQPPGLYVMGAMAISGMLMMVLSDLLFKDRVDTDENQLK